MNLTLKNKLYFILVIFLIMSLSIFIYLGFDVYKQLNVLNKTEELVYLSDKLSKFIHSIGANETSKDMEHIAYSANALINDAIETKENLLDTKEKSKDTMYKNTFIATKTKDLIKVMNKLVEITEENKQIRKDLEKAAEILKNDSQKLKEEISKFKI